MLKLEASALVSCACACVRLARPTNLTRLARPTDWRRGEQTGHGTHARCTALRTQAGARQLLRRASLPPGLRDVLVLDEFGSSRRRVCLATLCRDRDRAAAPAIPRRRTNTQVQAQSASTAAAAASTAMAVSRRSTSSTRPSQSQSQSQSQSRARSGSSSRVSPAAVSAALRARSRVWPIPRDIVEKIDGSDSEDFCFRCRELGLADEAGELLPCRGLCAHSWHLPCIPLRELPKETHWWRNDYALGMWPRAARVDSECEDASEEEELRPEWTSSRTLLMAACAIHEGRSTRVDQAPLQHLRREEEHTPERPGRVGLHDPPSRRDRARAAIADAAVHGGRRRRQHRRQGEDARDPSRILEAEHSGRTLPTHLARHRPPVQGARSARRLRRLCRTAVRTGTWTKNAGSEEAQEKGRAA